MARSQSSRINLDAKDLSLIDSSIQSMRDVPISTHLVSINLHSNYIQRIQGLELLRNLRHLDLSANQITEISGLDGLISLKILNLSCNLINVVEGLSGLRSLVKLNLSYNQIEDMSGLRSLGASGECCLAQLDLHGNKLRSVQHVHRSAALCSSLQHLVLSQDGSSNPLCHQDGYERELFAALPQLKTLNGLDRQGQHSLSTDTAADSPELEAYLDFLLSGGSTAASSSFESTTQPNVKTPKIDEMIHKFRARAFELSQSSSTSVVPTDAGSESESRSATPGRGRNPPGKSKELAKVTESDAGVRLTHLENELRRLQLEQHQMGVSMKSSSFSPARSGITDGGQSGERDEEEMIPVREKDSSKQTAASKKSNIGPTVDGKKGLAARPSGRKTAAKKTRAASRSRGSSLEREVKASVGSSSSTPTALPSTSTTTSQAAGQRSDSDHRHRAEMETTYVQLLKELEVERERRWKAEQATRKLADHVKEMQSKYQEESELRTTGMEALERLKRAVMNEREAGLRSQDQVAQLLAKLADLEGQVRSSRQAEEEYRTAARQLEETSTQQERLRLQQQAQEAKRLQDSELRAAAVGKEAELLRHTVQSQKTQIQQLQELLASREQQHKQDLGERYRLNSKELQEVLHKEVQSMEKRHQAELNACRDKVDILSRQYSELEEEFRLALQIEANRFKELQAAYERESGENAENKQLLLTAQRKDDQTSSMLAELTALVKEQKGRISELVRAKQEQALHYKERVDGLEASLDEARRRMVQFELLKQENIRMQSTLHGQESVIEGLKAERRLWGQELAQQGASLSQDRGRLEAKIDTLNQEVATLKKQLEKETDLVRIKTKMVDDQTETIRKLKEGILERDEQIRQAREEALQVQRSLEEQLVEERAALQDAQDLLEDGRSRKNELKQQVAFLQKELESSQHSHQQLSARWREKSELISSLEKRVSTMTTTWQDKEKTLTQEREKAIEAASVAIEKMRGMDDAFRHQLETLEKAHREEMAHVTRDMQQEVHFANEKVLVVEEEMRVLLRETEGNKRSLEEKVKKLTQALSDLQTGLLS